MKNSALLIFLAVLLVGCIQQPQNARQSIDLHGIKLNYTLDNGWREYPEAVITVASLLGEDANAIVSILKEDSQEEASLIFIAIEHEPKILQEEDLGLLGETAKQMLLGEGDELVEEGIGVIGEKEWYSMRIASADTAVDVSLTYCGDSLVKSSLFSSKSHIGKNRAKLLEILSSMQCSQ